MVALDRLRWTRGHYDADELDRVYTGNHDRVRLVLQACHWPTFEAACAAAGLTGAEDVSLFFQTLAKRLALGLLP